jgi:hypothetical protein
LVELVAPATALPKPGQGASGQKVQDEREGILTEAPGPSATEKEDRDAARHQPKHERSESLE